jgi:anti-anti-sigma regulatory factor
VIFSIFGKKDRSGTDRKRGAAPATVGGRSGPPTGAPGTAGAARGTDPREIARLTTAKIDEIESEMIAAARPQATPLRSGSAQAGLAGTVYVPSSAAKAAPAAPAAPPQRGAPAGNAPRPAVGAAGRGEAAEDTSIILGDAGGPDGGLSMEVGGSSLPPAFEEAAVLYSNGQGTAAAMILWQSIKENQAGGQARQAWAMLFDLYQASGRKEEFESLAIDYSARFETSPPTWDPLFAPPDPEARPAAANAPAAVALSAALDAQSVRQLEQVHRFAQRNRSVQLDAGAVRSVDPIGADLLLRVITAFTKAQRELSVHGVESLVGVLAGTIEAGRRDPSEACWLLQLELLRLLDRQQEFEDLSIDYCVTYEVSPPSWEPMPACIRIDAVGSVAAAPAAASDPVFSVGKDAFVLRGELEGRAAEALAALRTYSADRAETVIDCRELRRLDFTAAGELLNEVVALRTGGKYLVFKDLNHLVAALLAVMGIPDLAEIRLRRH